MIEKPKETLGFRMVAAAWSPASLDRRCKMLNIVTRRPAVFESLHQQGCHGPAHVDPLFTPTSILHPMVFTPPSKTDLQRLRMLHDFQ
jgi:hypothetical protein